MRTDEEIIDRIDSLIEDDFLGFDTQDLILALPFESAKKYLKDTCTADDWGEPSPRDRDSILEKMLEYMPFAWEKANDERGISASRTMSHYNSWIWLAGDDLGDLTQYRNYGKDNLRKICDYYGWGYEEWE